MRNSSRGFTFVEVLVAVSILGILLKVGSGYVRSDRIAVNQAATLLSAQITRARLEAIKWNTFAGITITTTGNGGYVLWRSTDNNSSYTAGTDVAIQTYTFGTGDLGQVKRTAVGTGNPNPNLNSFVFDSRGIPQNGSAGYVVLDNTSATYRKVVCVSSQGRTLVSASIACS